MFLSLNPSRIKKGLIISLSSALFLFACSESSTEPKTTKPDYGIAGDGNLTEILEYTLDETKVPAISALLFKDGQTIEMAAAGKTKMGGSEEVTLSGKWHVGSITKSMTATLAGIFVEKGLINWNSTIAEIFPEYTDAILAKYHGLTLQEFLTHSSGIEEIDLRQWYASSENIMDQRLEVAGEALNTEFSVTRGEFSYSNTGFTIAAAMLEKVGGNSWEELIQENLFLPFGLALGTFCK
ncbi:MAG: serine hydrolase [Calditrichaeota bacterium]|nr:serine hydrolase [Calditrichota bacterium]